MPPLELVDYFTAEKQGGILLGCLGLASLGLALFLLVSRSSFVAMAWPVAVVGIFQLVVGITVAARTPSQVASLEEGLRDAREFTATAALQQMNRVNASFRIVKGVEIGFILAGLLLVLFFRHGRCSNMSPV